MSRKLPDIFQLMFYPSDHPWPDRCCLFCANAAPGLSNSLRDTFCVLEGHRPLEHICAQFILPGALESMSQLIANAAPTTDGSSIMANIETRRKHYAEVTPPTTEDTP